MLNFLIVILVIFIIFTLLVLTAMNINNNNIIILFVLNAVTPIIIYSKDNIVVTFILFNISIYNDIVMDRCGEPRVSP